MIVKRIKEIAQRELSNSDEQSLDQLWDQINTVFQKWKLEHGDRNPKIASLPLSFRKRTGDKISFEDAEPWECAGLALPSLIGLAYKLWYEEYPEFEKILLGNDGCRALALLITKSPITSDDNFSISGNRGQDDLYNVSELLMKLQNINATKDGVRAALHFNRDKIEAGRKQQESLSMGNPAAAKKKTEKAADHHKQWRQWALDFLKNGPAWWDTEEVLDKVCSLVEEHNHTMANGKPYARRTIGDVITGVKKTLKIKK